MISKGSLLKGVNSYKEVRKGDWCVVTVKGHTGMQNICKIYIIMFVQVGPCHNRSDAYF